MTRVTVAWIAAQLLGLAACAGPVPYRPDGFAAAPGCAAVYKASAGPGEKIHEPQSACWRRAIEEHGDYDLLFAEFDDQGWMPGAAADPPADGGDYLQRLFDELQGQVDRAGKTGISLVVFVHGWHHSAAADDNNVIAFRALLKDVKKMEDAGGGRPVVGLYVGWRGDSLRVKGLDALTFWDRKNSAAKVAQGSVRELFERLDAMRDLAPGSMRMLTIGHSFGGLIVLEALEGEFIRAAARFEEEKRAPAQPRRAGRSPYLPRVGDLVLVVNPAVEGTRYEPLRAAAARLRGLASDQWPLLVTATSSADWATGIAFPAARAVNTLFETDPQAERDANVQTVGHNRRYITHELDLCPAGDAHCGSDCAPLADLDPDKPEPAHAARLAAELKHPPRAGPAAPPGGEAYLCGGLHLKRVGGASAPANPFWVVETSKAVMRGHDDIFNPAFASFVRQIYAGVLDAIDRQRHTGDPRGDCGAAVTGRPPPTKE